MLASRGGACVTHPGGEADWQMRQHLCTAIPGIGIMLRSRHQPLRVPRELRARQRGKQRVPRQYHAPFCSYHLTIPVKKTTIHFAIIWRPQELVQGEGLMNENQIGDVIVDCAIDLHRKLGPGLLESVYEVILANQLRKRGLRVEQQVSVAIEFEGERFDQGFRADLLVEDKVLIELKSKERVLAVDKKQVLTYLRLSELKLGYLMNFGEVLMKDGITRLINGRL